MKKLWEQIPKWLQALIWFFLLLYPIVIVNQAAIIKNLQTYSSFPWALLFVICTLWLFWLYTTGSNTFFEGSSDRKYLSGTQSLKTVNLSTQLLLSISLFALVCSANAIGFGLFGTQEITQLEFISYIGSAPGLTGPLLLLATALTAGIVEEIVFRGYLQTILTDNYGKWISFVSVAVIFTIGHLLPPSLYLQYFVVSIAFSWVADRVGSIIPGIIVHVLFDLFAFGTVYFSLSVSDPDYLSMHLLYSFFLLAISSSALIYVGLRLSDEHS